MIIRTTTPESFKSCLSNLKANGYTQITNAILPNWIAGDNYIEIDGAMDIFALTSPERAERIGFNEYK